MHDNARVKTKTREWLRLGLLIPCVWASLWLYRAIARLVPRMTSAEPTNASEVFPWVKAWTHETLESIQHKTHGFSYAWQYMACCAGLFAIYALVLWMARRAQTRWFAGLATAAPVIFMGMLIGKPAMLSSDVYAYSHYGRLLAVDGVDAHSPAAAEEVGKDKDEPFSLDGYYDFVPSVYGPFWTVISAGIVKAGHDRVGLTITMFRAFEALAALAAALLIWLILRRTAPEQAELGVLFFLWNPLVLMESALGGHNDMCMMALALLAVWLHLRGWKAGAVVALALSALVKVITWPLVPLYLLMVLRQGGLAAWRQSGWFLLRAGLGVAAAIVFSALAARMNPDGLVAHTASSAQFYENNYHEPLFKWVRKMMGEPADSLEAPMDFLPFWAATNSRAKLHDGVSNKSNDLCSLAANQPLLVISDQDSDYWLRVYNPANGMEGYVDWGHVTVIDEPPSAQNNPTLQRLSSWPPDWPTVIKANRLIRLVTWALLAAFGLLAAWKTRDLETFILWSAGFLVASQLLVFTKIWPWYMIWPLAYGALQTRSAPARLALMISATFPLLYALLDLSNSEQLGWLYDYRSIPTIVLPALLFAAAWLSRSSLNRTPDQCRIQ